MSDWNPKKYLLFKEQRTQPAIDLANRVRDCGAETAADIGCGPRQQYGCPAGRFPPCKNTWNRQFCQYDSQGKGDPQRS